MLDHYTHPSRPCPVRPDATDLSRELLTSCSPLVPHLPYMLPAAFSANVQHDWWARYLPLPPFLCLVIVLLSAYADRCHSTHVICIYISFALKKIRRFQTGFEPGTFSTKGQYANP
jgi:hypothetical protein